MRIGVDSAIAGEPELCLMAIGLGQPIGNTVIRDLATGLFVSVRRLKNFGLRLIGAYTESEPVELEVRPSPARTRRAAPAAHLVLALSILAVTSAAPCATLAATLADAGSRALRWTARYLDEEFVRQWRFAAVVVPPILAFYLWLWLR